MTKSLFIFILLCAFSPFASAMPIAPAPVGTGIPPTGIGPLNSIPGSSSALQSVPGYTSGVQSPVPPTSPAVPGVSPAGSGCLGTNGMTAGLAPCSAQPLLLQ
jgi:hypothetical protein